MRRSATSGCQKSTKPQIDHSTAGLIQEHCGCFPCRHGSVCVHGGNFSIGIECYLSSRRSTFSHASYAAFRPSYPPSLYDTILKYHQGPKNICIDLGAGHGVVARYLSHSFSEVVGTDPSDGMIEQARASTPQEDYPNLTFRKSTAGSLIFLENESVDLVVAGQAAHWFDTAVLFPGMARILRKSGTLAFWGYKDHVFVGYPKATKILNEYAYSKDERLLGSYWSQRGRSRVGNKLRDIEPPVDDWGDVQRIEYEPGTSGPKTGEGKMFLSKRMAIAECMNDIITWSSVSAFQTKARSDGGEGDVVDEFFDKMRSAEPDWQGEKWVENDVEGAAIGCVVGSNKRVVIRLSANEKGKTTPVFCAWQHRAP